VKPRNIVVLVLGAAAVALVGYRIRASGSNDPARAGYEALHDGRTQDAIVALREAVRLSPDDASARYNLGIALERAGWTDQAIAEYERAQKLDPGNATYRTGLAHTKRTLGYRAQSQGKHELAVRLYKEVLALTPDDPLVWYNLSVSYTKLGKPAESNEARMKAASLDTKYRPKVPR
jgi:Flp pilus assembly protein TadD